MAAWGSFNPCAPSPSSTETIEKTSFSVNKERAASLLQMLKRMLRYQQETLKTTMQETALPRRQGAWSCIVFPRGFF